MDNLPKKKGSVVKAVKERSSVGSMTSLQTTPSLTKDPKEFLRARGFEVKQMLTRGGFATIYEGEMKSDDPHYSTPSLKSIRLAIKVFDLTDPTQAGWIAACLKSEMFIAKYLKHPNIVPTFEVLKTRNHGYIVMALAPNGSLATDLTDRLRRPYTDEEAKGYFGGLVAGLAYMHRQNIAHRDLKLDNFLLSDQWKPMIGDFGFAARASGHSDVVLTEMLRKTRCGTRGYMAPELCAKSTVCALKSNHEIGKTVLVPPTESLSAREGYYDAKAVDVFALGVSLFEMFNLCKPFCKSMDAATVDRVRRGQLHYTNTQVAPTAQELIASMVAFDPKARPNIDAVQHHRWLAHSHIFNAVLGKLGIP